MAKGRVEREITALLQQNLEQTRAFHEASKGRINSLTDQDFPQFASELIAAQATAIRKLAAEIDELWARQENAETA